MEKLNLYVKSAKSLGVSRAKMIDAKNVVVSTLKQSSQYEK